MSWPSSTASAGCFHDLPTYAAVARYHGKIDKRGRTFEAFVEEAQRFARTEYLVALDQGSGLPATERSRIAAKVAEFSGLPRGYVEDNNLRVTTAQFAEQMLQSEHRRLSLLDGRYAFPAVERINSPVAGELPPGVDEAYSAGINAYLGSELGVHFNDEYKIMVASPGWDFTLPDHGNAFQNYLDLTPYVANVMRVFPGMRLFVGSGYYDLQAAFSSAERTISHDGFPRERVIVRHYQSGHPIYLQPDGVKALNADVRSFITH